jgi:sugar lactone lactonase YvrE
MRGRRPLVVMLMAGIAACASEPAAEDATTQAADAEDPPTMSTAASGWSVDTLVTVEGGTGGLSIGVDGTLYSSEFGDRLNDPDTAGKRIWAITPTGEASVFSDQLDGASGSAIDSQGYFYQSNIRGNTVSRLTPDGQATEFVAEGIQTPVGIEVDDADNLYVANCGSSSIQRVTQTGESSRFVESELLQCPNGITRDPTTGTFYVANFANGDLIAITAEGEASRLATLPGNNNGHLVYHAGSLYVVGRAAHQIFKVELDGSFEVFAGSGTRGADDGDAATATLSLPNDIAVNADGTIFYINEIAPLDLPHTELAPTRIRRIVRGGDS